MKLSRSATFAYDLSKQPLGYLVLYDEVIEVLIDYGLIIIKPVGDRYVIAKAVHVPRKHNHALNWRWYRERQAQAIAAATGAA